MQRPLAGPACVARRSWFKVEGTSQVDFICRRRSVGRSSQQPPAACHGPQEVRSTPQSACSLRCVTQLPTLAPSPRLPR